MKSVELQATSREGVRNKSALNALRKEGRVPAVLYGVEDNVNFHVNNIAFSKLINTPEVYFIDLKFEDKVIKSVIREVQFHPVTDEPIHIDFMAVYEDKPVTISVPVSFVGNSIGVLNGGKRREKLRKLVLKALPAAIPEQVEVDIAKLRIGQSIKVKDINLDGVELLDNANAVVIAIKTSRVAVAGSEMDDEEDMDGEEEGAEAETAEAAAE
jgi:large subunit ribosomal protein L25